MMEAEALQAKASSETGITPEEQAQLDSILTQIEELQAQLAAAESEVRMAALKAQRNAPTRSAPRVITTSRTQPNPSHSFADGLRYWLLSHTPEADMSGNAVFRSREAGFQLGAKSAKVPCNFRGLNFKQRTVLSKGGAASGAEWVPQTYSDKVVEYLTYFSPVIGVLGSETTPDGNLRTYFKIDDTSMKSAYITASGGSETNPTIAETNVVSASVDIGTFDITSGYQKVSFQELRDASASVGLVDKIAKANSNSHARKIEDEILNATGNGTTGVQGLLSVDNALDAVEEFDMDALEELYYSIPMQYREPALFLCNDAVAKSLRQTLKDTTGRSLFDRNAIDGVEWDTLLGKRFYISQYMPDDTILFFNPDFYMLRMVDGQIFQMFTEKFFPHSAWAGIMSFGGAWLGPTGASGAIHSLSIDASS
jgi:HK97 family phage major capsid protein